MGLCYGAQLMMHLLGGKVEKAPVREYGQTNTLIDGSKDALFAGIEDEVRRWWLHL